MKIDIYGKPYNQVCQDAVSLLKAAKIQVRFHNTDHEHNRKKLIGVTNYLQKEAGYVFKALNASPIPIVICDEIKEVLVGFDKNANFYDDILKAAKEESGDQFLKKYPEWKRKDK